MGQSRHSLRGPQHQGRWPVGQCQGVAIPARGDADSWRSRCALMPVASCGPGRERAPSRDASGQQGGAHPLPRRPRCPSPSSPELPAPARLCGGPTGGSWPGAAPRAWGVGCEEESGSGVGAEEPIPPPRAAPASDPEQGQEHECQAWVAGLRWDRGAPGRHHICQGRSSGQGEPVPGLPALPPYSPSGPPRPRGCELGTSVTGCGAEKKPTVVRDRFP